MLARKTSHMLETAQQKAESSTIALIAWWTAACGIVIGVCIAANTLFS